MSHRPGLDPERLDPPVYHPPDDRDRPRWDEDRDRPEEEPPPEVCP